MSHSITRRRFGFCAAAMAAAASVPSGAQSERPTTLIVSAPPGGSNDAVGRFLAEGLAAITQRPFVVENKPGASGTIGWGLAAKGPGDGSVLTITSSALAINPATMKRQPFDVLKDLSGVAGVAQSPLILVAHSQFPVQSARELRAFLQRDPAKATFAAGDSAGMLAATQLLGALAARAPIVNYKGTGPAMTDVAGGHVALSVTSIASVLPFIRGGQVKALGLLSGSRLKALPDVPTLVEQGIDVEFLHWLAVHVSSHVPRPVIDRLAADVQRVVNSPSFEARLDGIQSVPLNLGPRELDAFVATLVKRMASLAASAGLQPE
jgi:tripartite-type tricarboxylate transporter receptor subunit TctC